MIHQPHDPPAFISIRPGGGAARYNSTGSETDGSLRSGQFLTDTPLRSPVRPVLEAELLGLGFKGLFFNGGRVIFERQDRQFVDRQERMSFKYREECVRHPDGRIWEI